MWSGEQERSKGGPALELVVRGIDGRVREVSAGEALHPGDAVRFRVTSMRPSYAIIVGIDSAATVTPYFPVTRDAVLLPAGVKRLLDGSIVLDEALGAERIVLLLCDEPETVERVAIAGRRALAQAHGDPEKIGALALSCTQTSFLLRKTLR